MQSNNDLTAKIQQLEGKYDAQFKVVFDAIRQLIQEENKKGETDWVQGCFIDIM